MKCANDVFYLYITEWSNCLFLIILKKNFFFKIHHLSVELLEDCFTGMKTTLHILRFCIMSPKMCTIDRFSLDLYVIFTH